MKKISFLMMALACWASPVGRAQDAATEERLNKLNAAISDLRESQDLLKKHIEQLVKEVESLRSAQAAKPAGNYATQEDLDRLGKSVKDVDQNRVKDNEKITALLRKLQKSLEAPAAGSKKAPTAPPSETTGPEKPAPDDKAFPYVIKKGDTLDAIVQAYKDKSIKITVDQILKANPGLVPEKLKTGQKIWIPAPQS